MSGKKAAGAGPSKKNEYEDLPPVGSLSDECTPFKTKYDKCFNGWFSEKFLRGDQNLSVCDKYFKEYNDCLTAAMIRMNIDVKEMGRELIDSRNEQLKKDALAQEMKKK